MTNPATGLIDAFVASLQNVPAPAPVFETFQKIARWKRDIVITEKIDGSNAQVYIPEDDGPLLFGSRNRWVTPEADNAGFARWGRENEEALRRLGYGRHYGEWWGQGIQRTYGLKEKRFTLFNTGRWKDGLPEGLPANVGVVPILYQGPNVEGAIEDELENLRITGSRVAPGFMRPEGIVIFHSASRGLYKRTLENDEKPKGQDQ